MLLKTSSCSSRSVRVPECSFAIQSPAHIARACVRPAHPCKRCAHVVAAAAAEEATTPGDSKKKVSGPRRRSDHRIYSTSGVKGASNAVFQKLQETDGAFVVDAIDVESLPTAARVLAAVCRMAQEDGKHVTIQPFGIRQPLAFSVAFSSLETPPALPTEVTRVAQATTQEKLVQYIMTHVVMQRNPIVLEMVGAKVFTKAMMAIGQLRSRINWQNLEDDLYCSLQPIVPIKETPTKIVDGRPLRIFKYIIVLYPCGREKDNNPRYSTTTTANGAATAAGTA